jgi:putative transposase
MTYSTSSKLLIIWIDEHSHFPAKKTIDKLVFARRTYFRRYDRYFEGGTQALENRPASQSQVCSRIAKTTHNEIIDLALEHFKLTPREMTMRFTDKRRYFEIEAKIFRFFNAAFFDLTSGTKTSGARVSTKDMGRVMCLF